MTLLSTPIQTMGVTMKNLIIIPSYNDNKHLPDLIPAIQHYSNLPILIIDDGSDNPVRINGNNINIIRNESNLGKGATLKKGFAYASNNGYSHVITIDSDFQHSPEKINEFSTFDENCDLVCGMRLANNSMPIHRRISNKITSWIISLLSGQVIHDSQCGYRRYSVKAVLRTNCSDNGFQFESQLLIQLLQLNATIGHIKIPTIYGDEVSSIHNIADTFKFIKLIVSTLWQKH